MARHTEKSPSPSGRGNNRALIQGGLLSPRGLPPRGASPFISKQPVRVVAVEVVDGDGPGVRLAGLGVDDPSAGIVEDGDLPAGAGPADADQFLLHAAVQFERSEALPRIPRRARGTFIESWTLMIPSPSSLLSSSIAVPRSLTTSSRLARSVPRTPRKSISQPAGQDCHVHAPVRG